MSEENKRIRWIGIDEMQHADWNTTTPDTAKTYWANGLIKSIDNGVSHGHEWDQSLQTSIFLVGFIF